MTNDSPQQTGSCQCGAVRFSIAGSPLFRAYCHCLICQAFNQSDYADITVFYNKDICLEDEDAVVFRAHQQPPLLMRGACKSCGKPAIERLAIPLMPGMTIVPSCNIQGEDLLLTPEAHIFYHRRKADIADDVPKHAGYLNSQFHFGITAVKAMLRRRIRSL